MSSTQSPEILTIEQVAGITGLTVKTHRNMRSRGEGPRMWLLRGRVRCFRTDLDAWIAEQAGTANVVNIERRRAS